jgi:phage/plasmid-like protein (TIGR03299 family)
MSAELEMVGGVASMAFVGETPWHGNGKQVADEAIMVDPKRFIGECGLDWEAQKRQLFREVDGNKIPANAWEVVRISDGTVLANMVGERYTILQNREAFEWFRPFLDAKEALLHTAGALFGGSRIWILAKLNRDPMEISAGDIVEKYILLSHSHDGSLAVRAGFTPIRVVCWNTLSMAHSNTASKLIRLKHSKNVHQNLDNLREIMNTVNAEFEATAEQYRLLASKSINQNDLRKYVKKVFGVEADDSVIWPNGERTKLMKAECSERQKNILEEVMAYMDKGKGNNLPSVKGTYWAAYNSVTEYLSYVNGRNEDNRLDSLWFGVNNKLNKEALEIAVAMAA